LKIFQYTNDSTIHVRISCRTLADSSADKLIYTKKFSLAIQYDTVSKKFKFQVKFPRGKERLTYLSFNTASYIKSFVHPAKLSQFAIFFLKTNSNEFILKSENMDFIKSLFDNTGEGFVYYNLDAQKLSKVTNPSSLYRYLTGWKNVSKHLLKCSLKRAVIISKFIKENDQQKFFDIIKECEPDDNTIANPEILNGYRKRKSDVEDFVNYYKLKLAADPGIIRDYIALANQLNEKLNLDINSPKRLKEEHDKLDKKQRALKIPEFKTHDLYREVLISTDNLYVELIDNRERLAEESMIMNHCVYSYHDRIANGTCAIFSLINKKNNKERWTLELRQYRYDSYGEVQTPSFTIQQCRTYNNDPCPHWVTDEIMMQLLPPAEAGDNGETPRPIYEIADDNDGFEEW
jgi:hypothetical protein